MNQTGLHKAASLCIMIVAILGVISNGLIVFSNEYQIPFNTLVNWAINIACLCISIFCYFLKNKVTFVLIVATYYLAGSIMIYSNEMASIVGEFMIFAGFFIVFRSRERTTSIPIAIFTISITFLIKMVSANESGNFTSAIVYFCLVLIGFSFLIYIDTQFIDHEKTQATVFKQLLRKEQSASARNREIISVNAGLSGVVQIPDYIALVKKAYEDGKRETVEDLLHSLEIATKENARRVHAIRNFILTTDDDELINIEVNSFIENLLHLLSIEGKLLKTDIKKDLQAKKCAYFNPNVLRKFVELVFQPAFSGVGTLLVRSIEETDGCRVTIECKTANSLCPSLPKVLIDKMESLGAEFKENSDSVQQISVLFPYKTSDILLV